MPYLLIGGCYPLQHDERHGVAEGGAEDGVEGTQVRPPHPHPAGWRGALHLHQATPCSIHQVRIMSKYLGRGTFSQRSENLRVFALVVGVVVVVVVFQSVKACKILGSWCGMKAFYEYLGGSQDSLLVERLTLGRKVASSDLGRTGEFSSPELTFCANSYSVSVSPPVLLQWHIKGPGHSAKSVAGRLR